MASIPNSHGLNQLFARAYGTPKRGGQFSLLERLAVWNKAAVWPGRDPRHFRLDPCRVPISWSQYGDTTPGGMGWEIDHVMPVSAGGGDTLDNLQALQWQNNRKKGDTVGRWVCAISY